MRVRGRVLLVLLLLMCGCSAAPPAAPVRSADAPAPVVVLWHGWYGREQQALARIVERFNRSQTLGAVRLQPVALASMASEIAAARMAGGGSQLALVPATWLGALVAADSVAPLDDVLPAAERDALLPVTLAAAHVGSDAVPQPLRGVPLRFDTTALFYDARNLLVPAEQTDGLFDQLRALADPAAAPPLWGMALNLTPDIALGYLPAFDGQILDTNGTPVLATAGRAGAEAWLTWLAALQRDPRLFVRIDDGAEVDRVLRDTRGLATFDWAHRLQLYRNLWGDALGVAPLPALSSTGKPPQPYVAVDVLTLNPGVNAAEQGIAEAFLQFAISAEAQHVLLAADIQPVRRITLDESPQARIAAVFRTQAERGVPLPNETQNQLVDEELRLMYRRVLSGLTAPADGIAEAAARIESRLANGDAP